MKELATIGDFVNSMLFNIVWNHYDEMKTSRGKPRDVIPSRDTLIADIV